MLGCVGGTAFDIIYEAHPDYDYTLYVRNEERAKHIAEKFPDVKFVYGDLDSVDVIEKAASEADVVVRMSRSQTSPLRMATYMIRRHGGFSRRTWSSQSHRSGSCL